MSISRALACLVPVLLVFAVPAPAQKNSIPQPQVVRETEKDDEGLLQWLEWKAQPCPQCVRTGKIDCPHCRRVPDNSSCMSCAGSGKAPCPNCGGKGVVPDPLEKVRCPSCLGLAVLNCHHCGNKGELAAKGSGGNSEKCACCRGDGGYECTTCGGAGLVDSPRVKGGVAEAKLKDLKKARDVAQKTLDAVQAFKLDGDARKSGKNFAAMLSKSKRYFPALKRDGDCFYEVMKKLQAASHWKHFSEIVTATANEFLTATHWYLVHQIQVLDLCIARAEANEAALDNK